MEASALHAPAGLSRFPRGGGLLRLRSDEQLVALFRAGSDEAFGILHDRYRQRLFAYVRQMLCAGPRQDAEDVLQDVFVRAYGALRSDAREVNVRAWLYRVAHNRCIDHLRRPVPPAADIFELSRKPLHDPIEEAQRREELARLVADIGRLPEQQRSALLMREIDGMSYADLAGALDVSVPAIKSLLVRARVGLVEAADARDADCADIRVELMDAYDRGVKASSRARRHMKSCEDCTDYRATLRGMRRSFAALSPVAAGPLAVGAKLLGLAGGGGGAAAGGSAAAGGGAA
jgi:RNA polymerase sigma factor (sigma-70 family)